MALRRPAPVLAPLRAVVIVAALAGAVALIASDLSTLYEVRVAGSVVKTASGHAQHGYALLIAGLAALAMTLGAVRSARPALLALAALGVLALGIAIVGDLGDVHATGLYGKLYENAGAQPRAGFYEETLGGALLLIAGGGGLVLATPASPERPRRRRGSGRRAEAPAGEPSEQQPAASEPASWDW